MKAAVGKVMKKLKGVLVKEVQAVCETSDSEAETVAKLIERGYVVILKKRSYS